METMSLRNQPMSSHTRTYGSLRPLSRLPTPEAVNARFEPRTFKGQDYESSFLPDVAVCDRSTPWESAISRRDSRVDVLPTSPPYRSSDARRPLLPPLKTILGDAMSSPPQTPNLKSVSLQPSPCEPSFSTETYKPLAFYPNKKARTDFRLEPVAPVTNPVGLSVSGVSPSFYDGSRILSSTDDRIQTLKGNYARGRHHHSRVRDGNSIPHPTASSGSRRSSYRPGHSTHAPVTNAPFRPDLVHLDYECDPYHRQRECSITDSTCDDGDSDRREMERTYSYCASGQVDGALQSIYVERLRSERQDMYAPAEMLQPSHQASQPSYFIPNHYEYQQGKARKRSNLPKQSTEIMRTWFEQNISNPYPSEEQKAIFSSATGISMTQVSNWFINHRRRCPELRDKRDKVRGKDNEL